MELLWTKRRRRDVDRCATLNDIPVIHFADELYKIKLVAVSEHLVTNSQINDHFYEHPSVPKLRLHEACRGKIQEGKLSAYHIVEAGGVYTGSASGK
jgi:hypothetical protein